MSSLTNTDDTIYLDHAATTPVDPVVLEAMLPYFSERFGNPSSIYHLGQESYAAIEVARARVAGVLGCQAGEIVFTSGATESDSLALRGVAWAARFSGGDPEFAPHIITTAIEHHAIIATAHSLERQGFSATYVEPDAEGIVHPRQIAAVLRPETCLISVMYANNETGAIQPLQEIAAIAREQSILFHTDAVQAAGTLPLEVDKLGVDLMSLSAHKFYGPKGVGVLYVRRGSEIDYLHVGGGQEQGRRGGTENVPGIVGLGLALERADSWRDRYAQHCGDLRDRLAVGLLDAIPDATINGPVDPGARLPNNLNITIPGVQGETILLSLDGLGIAASAGSACTTGNTEPSHVLLAMGLAEAACRSTLRFTVGRGNTLEQISDAVTGVEESVMRIRDLVRSA